MGFANETTSVDTVQVQKTDDAGRLTRALPLYLAESFGVAYAARAICLVLVAKPGGPVVFGKMPDIDMFARAIPPSPGPQLVVLGAIVASGARIEVWDLRKHELIGKRDVACKLDDWAGLFKSVRSEVRDVLEPRKLITLAEPPTYYRVPPDDTLLHGYALALEQLLYQLLIANQLLPKEAMWNERGYFETQFGLVENWPGVPENARMIALAGVVAAALYGSTQFEPYRKIALRWLAEAPPGSVLDRVAPAVLKRLSEDTRLASWLERHEVGDARYAEWLERVRSPQG